MKTQKFTSKDGIQGLSYAFEPSDKVIAKFESVEDTAFRIGQIVLAKHPFKTDLILIKRISSINDNGVFLVGDNPDPTASEDSHNFGRISVADIIGVRQKMRIEQ